MKAIIAALKAERRRLAKEAKRIDSALGKFGVGSTKRRKPAAKKTKKAAAKKAAPKPAPAPAKKTKAKVEDEVAAKKRRKAELMGEAGGNDEDAE